MASLKKIEIVYPMALVKFTLMDGRDRDFSLSDFVLFFFFFLDYGTYILNRTIETSCIVRK